MDWKEAIKAVREGLKGLKLAEGSIGDLKLGGVEGDADKPGQSIAELLGVLESGLKGADTSADGNAASTLKLTKAHDKAKAENVELKAKLASAGDVDARVASAETKERAATERATLAETSLRSSRILSAARDKLDALGLSASQRKTGLALLNMDLDGVEVDDKGTVSGLEARLATLGAEHPDTFAKRAPASGAQGDGGGDVGGTGGAGAGTGGADGNAGASDEGTKYQAQMEAAMGIPPAAATT